MTPSFIQQFKHITTHGIKLDLAEKERIISPLLFSATMLILFAFSLGEVPKDWVTKIFIAESFLTILFALQTSFSRTFEPDQKDRVFEILQCYPLNHSAWFLGKYLLIILQGLLIVFPTMLLAGLLNSTVGIDLLNPLVFLVAFLALCGLASLGVLLSALTLKSSGKEILFPLLYFPLSTPILLAAIQSSLVFLNPENNTAWEWLGLLTGFNVIYFTLGILLFDELVDSL